MQKSRSTLCPRTREAQSNSVQKGVSVEFTGTLKVSLIPTTPEYHGFTPSTDTTNSLTFHFLLSSSLADEFNLYILRLYLFIEEFK